MYKVGDKVMLRVLPFNHELRGVLYTDTMLRMAEQGKVWTIEHVYYGKHNDLFISYKIAGWTWLDEWLVAPKTDTLKKYFSL